MMKYVVQPPLDLNQSSYWIRATRHESMVTHLGFEIQQGGTLLVKQLELINLRVKLDEAQLEQKAYY
jgi:hypothetical protein